MTFTIVLESIILVAVAVVIGYANYKTSIDKGKKIYCDINCKHDEKECDFLNINHNSEQVS